VSNWTTETDSQASGSAANAVDINESGSGKVESGSAKVGESESAICLQDRLKWLDKPVVRKVVVFFLKAHPHEFLQSKVFHAKCCFMFDYT
jgi:hypothetical protein